MYINCLSKLLHRIKNITVIYNIKQMFKFLQVATSWVDFDSFSCYNVSRTVITAQESHVKDWEEDQKRLICEIRWKASKVLCALISHIYSIHKLFNIFSDLFDFVYSVNFTGIIRVQKCSSWSIYRARNISPGCSVCRCRTTVSWWRQNAASFDLQLCYRWNRV